MFKLLVLNNLREKLDPSTQIQFDDSLDFVISYGKKEIKNAILNNTVDYKSKDREELLEHVKFINKVTREYKEETFLEEENLAATRRDIINIIREVVEQNIKM